MKLLIVDNNLHIRGYPQEAMVLAHLPLKYALCATVVKADKLEERHKHFDKVILTGSTAYVRQKTEWMKKELDLIGSCIEKKTPVLGICFGSQMLATKIFGEDGVEAMPVPFSGSMRFKQKGKSGLFKGLPREFGVVSTHYEITKIPVKYSIGEVEDIRTYAFFYPPNLYGIQFHPELMGWLGRKLIRLQKLMYDRLVYQDFSEKSLSKYGKNIYRNFINL